MSSATPPPETGTPAEKVKQFPAAPGVYLMKDAQGRLLYVGKAKNLRNRAGHYFTRAAAEDKRTADLVQQVVDIDFLPAETEVDALLLEARLVKDIQPRFNVELKDDKSFPYLQIRIREDFPRVEFTRSPRRRGVKLYGPFTSTKSLRAAIQVLQRIFQFRTCGLDIKADDERWCWACPRRRGRSRGWTSRTWTAMRRWRRWCRSSTGCRSSRATGATGSRAWLGWTTSARSARW